MSFNIDHQTYKDLNIFGNDSGSMFNLFKGTRTIGARNLLNVMMQNPSSDIHFLKARRDSIFHFYQHQFALEIRNEELDLIEFYLKSDQRKSKTNLLDSIANYTTRNSSNDYYIIHTGLKYLIKLTKAISMLVDDILSKDNVPESLVKSSERIQFIIGGGLLSEAVKLNENALHFYQITKLDHAFRGKEKENLFEFLQIVYEFDVFETLALIALKKDLCFPEYLPGEDVHLSVTDFFHPEITNPVKNSVKLKKDNNIIFLTGANMAGKSSLLKSLGLCIYLSHLGFPVAASKMEMTPFTGLITTINLPDDIGQGLSHYYSEVKRIKQVAIALHENQRMFVILDELFRGTNVKDAFEASLLIISELTHIRNSVFLISTHIIELAEALDPYHNISFKYLDTFFEDNQPRFTYQLKDGVSKDRLGMFIVEQERIVDLLKKASGRET